MIDKIVKVVLLEDSKNDQELIKRQVSKALPKAVFTIANNYKEFEEKLKWASPDIILSDYNLPDCNGLTALLYVKENLPHVPFLFVTGTLNNEEKVADAVLSGASGYILKGNLKGIPEKVVSILEESMVQREKLQKKQAQLRKSKLLLQKANHYITQVPEFEKKSELETILKEIETNFVAL